MILFILFNLCNSISYLRTYPINEPKSDDSQTLEEKVGNDFYTSKREAMSK